MYKDQHSSSEELYKSPNKAKQNKKNHVVEDWRQQTNPDRQRNPKEHCRVFVRMTGREPSA